MDVTGGLDPQREYVFGACPPPGVGDAASMWLFDERGAFAVPRFGIDAAAPKNPGGRPWDVHIVQFNLGFPDGRLYRVLETGAKHPTTDEDGRHAILGAGPLSLRCVAPFRAWQASFHGSAVETSADRLARGDTSGPRIDLQLDVDAAMAAPPWVMGSLRPDAPGAREMREKHAGAGRIEQLFRADARLRVGGEEHAFRGSGLRVRRQGVRQGFGDWGHCWMSGLFPSGQAFGLNIYPPGPDGVARFNEGYLDTADGRRFPAEVVEAPWLASFRPSGEDASVVLDSELGRITIEGETVVSVFNLRDDDPTAPYLSQGMARYRWDGEETYGMIERSTARDRLAPA
jgi:hypothetical protein